MADYLSHLVAKSVTLASPVRPRPLSLYEPLLDSRALAPDPGQEEVPILDGVGPQDAAPEAVRLRSPEAEVEPAAPDLSQQSRGRPLLAANRPSPPRREREGIVPSLPGELDGYASLRRGELAQYPFPSRRELERGTEPVPQPLRPADRPPLAGQPSPVQERVIERIVVREQSPAARAENAPAGGGFAQAPQSPAERRPLPPAQGITVQPRIRPVAPDTRQPSAEEARRPAAGGESARTAGLPSLAPEEPATTIHVTIGRIEVRAMPPAAPIQKSRSEPVVMSLNEYLKQRATGGGQ